MYLFKLLQKGKNSDITQIISADITNDDLVDASKTDNSQSINSFLAGGNKTLIIAKPGVYNITGPIVVEDNTSIFFGDGVIFRKNGNFRFSLRNKKSIERDVANNKNIYIFGFHLDGNSMRDAETDALFVNTGHYGCMGEILLKNVEHVTFQNLKIENAKRFCVQLVDFFNVTIKDFVFKQCESDGFHINRGRKALFENGYMENKDDNFGINARDWAKSAPNVGTITDIEARNVYCKDFSNGEKPHGRCVNLLPGAMTDWASNVQVTYGDLYVNNGQVYRVVSQDGRVPTSTTFVTSKTAPTHTDEQIRSLDGIYWKWQGKFSGKYDCSIKNILFKNVVDDTARHSFVLQQSSLPYDRCVQPGTTVNQLPVITMLNVQEFRYTMGGLLIVDQQVAKEIKVNLTNCESTSNGVSDFVKVFGSYLSNGKMTGKISVAGCYKKNATITNNSADVQISEPY